MYLLLFLLSLSLPRPWLAACCMAICYSYGTQEEPSKKQRTELNWLNSCPICSISSSALAWLGSAHVPAICIAVCLNCVNRPKLRISFGFNLELAACLLSRFPTPSSSFSLSASPSIRCVIPFVSQYVYLNASHSKSTPSRSRVELRKWFRLACRATLSRYTRTRTRTGTRTLASSVLRLAIFAM